MKRRQEKLYSPALGRDLDLLVFGHFGAPVIAFPSGGGAYFDFENNGMVGAVSHLIERGVIKLYCPSTIDHESWLNQQAAPHQRGLAYNAYQAFVVDTLVPAIRADCNSADMRIAALGCSLGAYHAATLALKFPHIFHYALCMSGLYDVARIVGGSDSAEIYFNNPLAFVPNLHGDALEHVRNNTHLTLVCGQGAHEDNNLIETNRLAAVLTRKGISNECDIWGHDVEHHWYWWRKQIVHHLDKTFT